MLTTKPRKKLPAALYLLAALCLLLSGCATKAASSQEVTRVLFDEGERFVGYSVLSGDPEKPVALEDLPGAEKLVFYLSHTCKDCITDYDGYQYLAALLEDSEVALSFLWQSTLPKDDAVPALPRSRFYRVDTDLRLGDWVPTYFYLDADNKILMKSIELTELAAYVKEHIPAETRRRLLQRYLEREGMILLLTPAKPDGAAKKALEGLVSDGKFKNSLVVGPKKGQNWAGFCDSAGVFAAMADLGDTSKPVYLYAQNGEFIVSEQPPV
jgi:hypothetical protein